MKQTPHHGYLQSERLLWPRACHRELQDGINSIWHIKKHIIVCDLERALGLACTSRFWQKISSSDSHARLNGTYDNPTRGDGHNQNRAEAISEPKVNRLWTDIKPAENKRFLRTVLLTLYVWFVLNKFSVMDVSKYRPASFAWTGIKCRCLVCWTYLNKHIWRLRHFAVAGRNDQFLFCIISFIVM